MIYGYSRLSIEDGSRTSIENQQAEITRYSVHRWPTELVSQIADNGISGGVPLANRPSGSILMERLQRGDHLVAAKIDRLFRSVADGADVIGSLERRGVSLHLLDLQIDTSSPIGKAMAHVAIAFAQLERERIGERISAAKQYLRSQGRPYQGSLQSPVGWQVIKDGGDRKFVKHSEEREIATALVLLREQGMTWPKVAEAAEGVQPRSGLAWTRHSVRRYVIAAQEGFPLVSDKARRWARQRKNLS